MSRRTLIPLIVVVVVVLAVVFRLGTPHAPGAGGSERRIAEERGDAESAALLVGVGTGEDAVEGSDVVAPTGVSARRPAGSAPVEEPVEEPVDEPAPPVMGVVVDHAGATLAGVRVGFRASSLVDATRTMEIGRRSRINMFSSSSIGAPPELRHVTTDAAGAFTFEGTDRRDGGRLTYGERLLVSDVLNAEVDREATYQVLVVPRCEVEPATWRLRVVDLDGAPVLVDSARLVFVGGTSAPYARLPRDRTRVVQLGSIEQRELPLGEWRMDVEARDSLSASATVRVHERSRVVESELVVPTFEGAIATEIGVVRGSEEVPWVDPGGGLLEWLPEGRLKVGESVRDRHFAHTFLLGFGPVRAAQLTLELESNSGMSHNDGLYLEHLGERRFAWTTAIKELTGGRWDRGDRRVVRIDLGRLPGEGGGVVDLLPYLEDGRFDVVLQDDTVVHDIGLRVLR